MIIHAPEISRRGEATRVTAGIESPGLTADSVWFEVDGDLGEFLSDRSDAFAAAVLSLAAVRNEPLEVRGVVSPRLAWGMREYLRVQHCWWPDYTSEIDLKFERLEPWPEDQRGNGVGLAFSGGVDSFHTLFEHAPSRETMPGFAITHGLIVNGFDFDVDLEESGWFDTLRYIYGPVFERSGVRLVTVRSNLQILRSEVLGHSQSRSQTLALLSAALVLGPLFSRFYISGFHERYRLTSHGCHPVTDPLIATEGLHVIHEGCHLTRSEKIAAIAEWPETWDRLRVCRAWWHKMLDTDNRRIDNCCRCEKCVRTIVACELLGLRGRFSTFRKPLTWRAVAAGHYQGSGFHFGVESLRSALRQRRFGLASALARGLAVTWVKERLRRRA